MKRWLARLALLAAVGASGCGDSTGPTKVAVGTPFTLAPGEAALVDGADLLVGFTGVPTDSRCPVDVTCIVAGDAAVDVWIQRTPEPRLDETLHTDPALGDSVEIHGRVLRLVTLQPSPRTARTIAMDDYRAGFEVR